MTPTPSGWPAELSTFTREQATAANAIDRALAFNPNSAHAWMARGLGLVLQNRPEQRSKHSSTR